MKRGKLIPISFNFKVRADDDEGLNKWLTKSQCKYTSPDVQNEILHIMALSILQDISSALAGK